jgi:hypothetical protein
VVLREAFAERRTPALSDELKATRKALSLDAWRHLGAEFDCRLCLRARGDFIQMSEQIQRIFIDPQRPCSLKLTNIITT